MNLTDQQQQTVSAPRGNILVSAAAGSGKTSTMTERIVSRIIRGELDIRNVLVMTFTEAAAKNMRNKIEEKLRAAKEDASSDQQSHLQKQLAFLSQSSVSTIHAFCLDVIRNFYYEVTDASGRLILEPGFRIEEEGEAKILLEGALDDLFEKYYTRCDEQPDAPETRDFLFLVDAYGSTKDDKPVRGLLLSFYHFLRSMPDYEGWIEEQRRRLERTIGDFDRSPCFRAIQEGLELRAGKVEEGIAELDGFLSRQPCLYKNDRNNAAKNADALESLNVFRHFIKQGNSLLKNPDAKWDDLYSFFQNMPAIPALSHHSAETPEKAEWIALFEQYFAETLYYTTGKFGTAKYESQFLFEKCFAFARSQAEITRELRTMQPAIEKFLEILTDLDQAYTEAKRQANMVDFDDFEHLALKILKTDTVRQYYRDKFREIYVDEYQDTSSIQEAILEEIVCENCFMVGDVKQSIYKFRHAKPQIFIEKKETLRDHTCTGTVFELNQNFRSVSGILHAVNDVFYQIMSQKAGEIDYNDKGDTQALVPHRKNTEETQHPAEILLVDLSTQGEREPVGSEPTEGQEEASKSEESVDAADGERKNGDGPASEEDKAEIGSLDEPTISKEESTKYQKEALAVAVRIQELLSEKIEDERTDENGKKSKFMRCVKPADIAILARTRSICGIFAEALVSLGLPVEQEQTETFLDRYELKVIEALLIVLDNPMQDIPLVSVMRAPLFESGFCEEDLLCIRIAYKDKAYFYECCESYAVNGQDIPLREKLKSFYQWLDRLRDGLAYKSVSELIEEVYTETEFLAVAARMPDGLRRVTALQEFQDWARAYDQSRQSGLYSFLRYMEAVHEKSPGQSPFGVEQSRTDAVKVMTMHKSKGLEYKVVFLVGNNRKLASKETKDPILVSEEFGIGFQYVDVKRQFRYPTPLILSMREDMHKAEMAEEMRLLYVGMTRAMDRLFITGTCSSEDNRNGKGLAAQMAKAREYVSCEPLPPHMALSAKSTLEWVMMSVARNPFLDFAALGVPSPGKLPERDGKNRFFNNSWALIVTGYSEVQKKANAFLLQKDEPQDIEIEPERPETSAFSPERSLPKPDSDASTAGGKLFEETFELYKKTFLQEYPYADAVRSPLKVSVSEIKRREQDKIWDQDEGKVTDQLPLPSFVQPLRGINVTRRELDLATGTHMSKSDIGIAVHSFLRYMDLESLMKNPSKEAITAHMDRMADLGMIRKEEHAHLKNYINAFERYLQSNLAGRILAAVKKTPPALFREIPFTISLDCKTLLGGHGFGGNDATFVQGMIDCWFVENNEAVLVDYKTDRIEGTQERIQQILEDRYRTQLSIYALAIRKTTGIHVKESILWLVDETKAYSIETDGYFR